MTLQHVFEKIREAEGGLDTLTADELRAYIEAGQATAPMRDAPEAAPVPTTDFASVPLAEFVEGQVEKPRWAVERIWPEGAAGVIGGRPKGGKSTAAMELAISLWTSTPMFNLPSFPTITRPASILYIQQENANSRVVMDAQRILAARELGVLEEEVVETSPGDFETLQDFTMRPDLWEWVYSQTWEGTPPRFDVISHQGIDLSKQRDRDWLWRKAEGYSYVFLDPLYMLAGSAKISDGGDEMRPILSRLVQMKDATGCAPIVTHHMTDSESATFGPAALLGTTFIHAWYEAALLIRKMELEQFTVMIDAERVSEGTKSYNLNGLGVGRWFYAETAQDVVDSTGRPSPQLAGKALREARLQEQVAEHPDWDTEKHAAALGIAPRTVQRYQKAMNVHWNDDGVDRAVAG